MYQYKNSLDPFIPLNLFALLHSLGSRSPQDKIRLVFKETVHSMGFLKSSPGDQEGHDQAVILVKIQVSYINGWGVGIVSRLYNTTLLSPLYHPSVN